MQYLLLKLVDATIPDLLSYKNKMLNTKLVEPVYMEGSNPDGPTMIMVLFPDI